MRGPRHLLPVINARLPPMCSDMLSIAARGVRIDTLQIDAPGIVASAQVRRIERLTDHSMPKILMLKKMNMFQH